MHPLHEKFAPARRTLSEQLGASAARFLLERMAARELAEGADLLEQGVDSDALYFVLGGAFDVRVGAGSSSLSVGRIDEGQWVGEVTFIEPGPASATVRATEPALVVELRNRDLAFLTDENPEAAAVLLGRLCRELADRGLATASGLGGGSDEAPVSGWRRLWPFGGRR